MTAIGEAETGTALPGGGREINNEHKMLQCAGAEELADAVPSPACASLPSGTRTLQKIIVGTIVRGMQQLFEAKKKLC